MLVFSQYLFSKLKVVPEIAVVGVELYSKVHTKQWQRIYMLAYLYVCKKTRKLKETEERNIRLSDGRRSRCFQIFVTVSI